MTLTSSGGVLKRFVANRSGSDNVRPLVVPRGMRKVDDNTALEFLPAEPIILSLKRDDPSVPFENRFDHLLIESHDHDILRRFYDPRAIWRHFW